MKQKNLIALPHMTLYIPGDHNFLPKSYRINKTGVVTILNLYYRHFIHFPVKIIWSLTLKRYYLPFVSQQTFNQHNMLYIWRMSFVKILILKLPSQYLLGILRTGQILPKCNACQRNRINTKEKNMASSSSVQINPGRITTSLHGSHIEVAEPSPVIHISSDKK